MIAQYCIMLLVSCGLHARAQQPKATTTVRSYGLDFYNDMKPAKDAISACKSKDAWLVEIKDEEIHAAVQSISNGNHVWIGVSGDDKQKWNDGEKVRFAKWRSSPTPSSSHGAVMDSSGKWSTTNSVYSHAYVCQSDLTYMGSLNVTEYSSPKTFEEANKSCESFGSNLVEIKTAGLQSFLIKNLTNNGSYYWTSGNDIASEGTWIWGDGTAINISDSNWFKNKPDRSTAYNCLAMSVSHRAWFSQSCSGRYPYICYQDLSYGNCGDEMCSNMGTCSIMERRYNCTCNVGYFGTKCEKNLLEISTPQSEHFVYKGTNATLSVVVKSYDGDVTLTLTKDVSASAVEIKVTSVDEKGAQVNGTFELVQPSDNATYYIAATPSSYSASYSRNINFTVFVFDKCDPSPCQNGGKCVNNETSPYYSCECKPAYQGLHCQERSFATNDSCKYHVNYDNKANLDDATDTCVSLGGVLVIIKSREKQSFLENLAKSMYGNNGEISFWIGGNKRSGQWFWQDGTVVGADDTFSGWAAAFPQNFGSGMTMTSLANIGGDRSLSWSKLDWLDAGGKKSDTGYICEVKVTSSCPSMECKNGGSCVEIGCQTSCRCAAGYGGKQCDDNYLTLTPAKTSYAINANENVTFPVNITSRFAPITVKVSKKSGVIDKKQIVKSGIVNFTIGPWSETGSVVTLTFSAHYSTKMIKREATISVKVKALPAPTKLRAELCGTNVTVKFSVSPAAIGLKHRIVITKSGSTVNTKTVIPPSAGEIDQIFPNMIARTTYLVKVTICPSKCTRPSSTATTFTTTDDIPRQPMQYLLVTKNYHENICVLQWSSLNSAVTKFQLNAQSRDPSGKVIDTDIEISGEIRRYAYDVMPNSNYSFAIQAHTCDGLGPVMAGIGQCSTITSQSSSSVAAAVLGVLFALSLIAIGAIIFLWFRKYGRSADGKGSEKGKGNIRPYETTFFEGDDHKTEGGYEIPIDAKDGKPAAESDNANKNLYDNINYNDSEFDDDEEEFSAQQSQYENVQELKNQPVYAEPSTVPKMDVKFVKSQPKPSPLAERPKVALNAVKKPTALPKIDAASAKSHLKPTPSAEQPKVALNLMKKPTVLPKTDVTFAKFHLKPTPTAEQPKVALNPMKKPTVLPKTDVTSAKSHLKPTPMADKPKAALKPLKNPMVLPKIDGAAAKSQMQPAALKERPKVALKPMKKL